MKASLILASLFLFISAPRAQAAEPFRYVNERFEFQLSYSSTLFNQGTESDNGDGITAVSRDGVATLIAYGSYSPDVLGQSLEDIYEQERTNPARHVTLQRLNRAQKYFVISGFENGSIFYMKSYVIDGVLKALDLRYPESARAPYDKEVGELVKCFKPGL